MLRWGFKVPFGREVLWKLQHGVWEKKLGW